MSETQEKVYILPAECVGAAETKNGVLNVGGLEIQLSRPGMPEGWPLGVYVRRLSSDLSVFEVALSFGDGLAQEELDEQNDQAAIYPGGPKEYWRAAMVGKYVTGADQHVMTNEDFEADWHEADEDDDDDEPDFDPHELANGSDADRARLREFYRAVLVGQPDVTGKVRTDEDFEESWPAIEEHLARMARGAEAKSNVADVVAPAGEYFLGDPCYAVPHVDWHPLLDSSNFFETPTGHTPDGTQVIAYSTAYGDGCFWDDEGNSYAVDAGLIGLVPVTDATTAALAETEQRHGSIMTRVQFAEPVLCSREGRGLLTFGQYQIDTA